jgi:DNA replication protein DnaC
MTTFKLNREQAKKQLAKGNSTIITGLPGVGKTTLVRKQRMVSASHLAMEYQAHGLDAVKAIINSQVNYQNLTVVIDDLGIEEDVKHFGNGLDPIAYVIQRIYDINQAAEKPITLLLTTNFGKEYLTEKYGPRVVDRLWEMCDRIVLEDTNLRQENNG